MANESSLPPDVFTRLVSRLESQGAVFEVLHHAPVYTSEEAAAVRGSSLASGAKALICKVDDRFMMLVMPADRRLDSKRLRRTHGFRSIRFARAEEVFELTGLRPGAIPPFGSLFDLPTLCDTDMSQQAQINFNAGDHARSIRMPYADYVRVEQPEVTALAAAADA